MGVPALSLASPWLNTNITGITDAAYEAVPWQLLARLRPDSVGSVSADGSVVSIWFTGLDGYRYAVEASSNLRDWSVLSTNSPYFGVFEFQEVVQSGAPAQFYRSVLLP